MDDLIRQAIGGRFFDLDQRNKQRDESSFRPGGVKTGAAFKRQTAQAWQM